jgi:hypothetical protein
MFSTRIAWLRKRITLIVHYVREALRLASVTDFFFISKMRLISKGLLRNILRLWFKINWFRLRRKWVEV